MSENPVLEARIAKIIIKYTHSMLTEEEADLLDEWICESDENLAIYEDLTGDVTNTIFDPEELIENTDAIIELWMVAGLIAKEQQRYLTSDEKRFLVEWTAAGKENERIYKALSKPANMQRFDLWLKKQIARDPGLIGLSKKTWRMFG